MLSFVWPVTILCALLLPPLLLLLLLLLLLTADSANA
jgi:hypothetical protein